MVDYTVFKIIDVNYIKREKSLIFTQNKKYNVLSYRMSGNSIFKYKGKQFNVTPQDILYIPSGCTYSQSTLGEEVLCIHFEAAGETFDELQIVNINKKENVLNNLNKILTAWSNKEKNYIYHSTGYLYDVIAETSVALPKKSKYKSIFTAIEYLKEYCTDTNFKISDIYDFCHISHSSLNALFKKETGKTPIQYANEIKIKKAKLLLSCSSFTTSEISELCGFNDTKYFYTMFHKITGYTIKEYKRNIFNDK